MRHPLQRTSFLALGLVIVTLFGLLEVQQRPAVRASFTLVGIVDCGQRSGRDCPGSTTVTIVSDDSGTMQPYTIDLSWVKDKLPGRFEQDQQVRIEIERLPDGTLMALRVIDLNDRKGTQRDDEGPRPTSTDDDEEDDTVEITGGETCVPSTVTTSVLGTTTRTASTDTTVTTTTTTTVTDTTTTVLALGFTTTSRTAPACGTTTVTSTLLSISDTTTTSTTVTTATTTETTLVTTTSTEICRMPLGGPIDEDDVVGACAEGGPSLPSWLESMAPVWQPVTGWWNTLTAGVDSSQGATTQ